MEDNLLVAINCRIEASNSEFTNATNATLALVGGSHRFTHCTIANYKRIGNSRNIQNPCLILSNNLKESENELSYPLRQAYFDNCIIDGSFPADSTHLYRGELMFSATDAEEEKGHESVFNYRFNACFIKTARVENDRFTGNLFVKSPTYLKLATKEDAYAYDFRLANESEGVGRADHSVAAQYPTDRYGVDRLTGETAPSVGAYEYVYREEEAKE
jgi:hypothetical protein